MTDARIDERCASAAFKCGRQGRHGPGCIAARPWSDHRDSFSRRTQDDVLAGCDALTDLCWIVICGATRNIRVKQQGSEKNQPYLPLRVPGLPLVGPQQRSVKKNALQEQDARP